MKRFILLAILALEGLGGISGGLLLVAAPDGHLMDLQVEMMNGTFPNFLIPGIILTGMGLLTTAAFIAVLIKRRISWVLAYVSLLGYVIWFTTEIIILHGLHWLHIVWGTPILVGLWAAFPLLPRTQNSV